VRSLCRVRQRRSGYTLAIRTEIADARDLRSDDACGQAVASGQQGAAVSRAPMRRVAHPGPPRSGKAALWEWTC
jgi:hypothetical protein